MQMEENQLGFAGTVSGGLGTVDTTLIERVEPSSFVAAGGSLRVHLAVQKLLHVLEKHGQPHKVHMFL